MLDSLFPMRFLDLGVILAYLIGITWFGSRFRSNQKTLKDYFLGGAPHPGGPSPSPLFPRKPVR